MEITVARACTCTDPLGIALEIVERNLQGLFGTRAGAQTRCGELAIPCRGLGLQAIKSEVPICSCRHRIERSWAQLALGDQLPPTLLRNRYESFVERLLVD